MFMCIFLTFYIISIIIFIFIIIIIIIIIGSPLSL
jgi:hypothetical protein